MLTHDGKDIDITYLESSKVLREAARIFRESKISDEKSKFLLFRQTSLSVNLFRKKYFKVSAIIFPDEM